MTGLWSLLVFVVAVVVLLLVVDFWGVFGFFFTVMGSGRKCLGYQERSAYFFARVLSKSLVSSRHYAQKFCTVMQDVPFCF